MSYKPYFHEILKILFLTILWLITCLIYFETTLSLQLIILSIIIGFLLRIKNLNNILERKKGPIIIQEDILFSRNFKLFCLILQGNSNQFQDLQSLNTLISKDPCSFMLDIYKEHLYIILYSRDLQKLEDKKEAIFLHFSQIFPDAQILSGIHLERFYNRFRLNSNGFSDQGDEYYLVRNHKFVDNTPLESTNWIFTSEKLIFFSPYLYVSQKTVYKTDSKKLINDERILMREPYLLLSKDSTHRLGFNRNSKIDLNRVSNHSDCERIFLGLPLSNTDEIDAKKVVGILINILESKKSQNIYLKEKEFLSENEKNVSQNLILKPVTEANTSFFANKNEEWSDLFCNELCDLQTLDLPKKLIQNLCTSLQSRSKKIIAEETVRKELKKRKLIGMEDLVLGVRKICKDLPFSYSLCLLHMFTCEDSSVFDLREIRDLIHILKIVLPIWLQEDQERILENENEKICCFCHLRELSPESCIIVSKHLEYIFEDTRTNLQGSSELYNGQKGKDMIKKIIIELKTSKISLILPCIIKKISLQTSLDLTEDISTYISLSSEQALSE